MLEILKEENYNDIIRLGSKLNAKFLKLYPKETLFNNYTKIVGYKIDNSIVGFIHYEVLGETVSILNLIVEKQYRKKNIGTYLLDYLMSDICNKDIKNILLEVKSSNYPAISLYTKFNFETINIRKKYYDGIDAIVMERRV